MFYLKFAHRPTAYSHITHTDALDTHWDSHRRGIRTGHTNSHWDSHIHPPLLFVTNLVTIAVRISRSQSTHNHQQRTGYSLVVLGQEEQWDQVLCYDQH